MRTITDSGNSICSVVQYDSFGNQYQLANSVTPFIRRTFSRSDIVRTAKPVLSGWRPPLPYDGVQTASDNTEVFVSGTQYGLSYEYRGKLQSQYQGPNWVIDEATLSSLLPVFGDSTYNRCLTKTRNNLANRVASFSESVLEARSTIQTFTGLARNIDMFLVHASKRNWRRAALSLGLRPADHRVTKAVGKLKASSSTLADAWLGFNFGISPIISDMTSLMILLGAPVSYRVSASSVAISQKRDERDSITVPLGFTSAIATLDRVRSIRSGWHVRLDYSIDSEFMRSLTAFGVVDIVQAGWAVVPYSWLVDFVLPVSSVLKSMTASLGLSFLGGSRTRFCRFDFSTANTRFPNNGAWVTSSADAVEAALSSRKFERRVFASEPYPSGLWLKDPFGAFEALSVLSLIAKRLS